MRIIIVGAGSVGSHLAAHLSRENHDVTVIDHNVATVKILQDQLDIMAMEGNGASPTVLKQAGIERCDLLMAVTNSDETNMIAGLAAAQFNVPFKIARVSNTDYYQLDNWLNEKNLGLDLLINPELVCALQIKSLLDVPGASDVAEFAGGRVLLLGLTIQDRAPCLGRSLQEIRLQMTEIDFLVVAVTRDGETILPNGQTVMQPGDQAYFICKKEALDKAYSFSGLAREPVRRAMVLGGSKVAIYLCRMLQKAHIHGTLIEAGEETAEHLAGELDDTLVIQGGATDIELLEAEGLNEVDAFLALTRDDEDNLLTGLIARNHKVPNVIALLEKLEYVPLVNKVGVNSAVSSRLAVVDTILKYVRRGNILSLATLKNNRAEIIEFQVTEKCRLIGRPVKDLKIKPRILLGMVTRGRDVFMPTGFSQLEVGDKVVVIGRPESQHQLEALFP